jgi:ribosomal protein S12 methylthiotransferase
VKADVKTAAVVTLGCPMNQVDSESIMGGMVARGFTLVPETEARVIVVNTCGFLEDACKESIDTILELAELKNSGRLERLVVAGCLVQRYGQDLSAELPEADAVIGLEGREGIPELCESLLDFPVSPPQTLSRVISGPAHSAYLKIAEGCDNRCTYCKIPSIRGRYRSRPVEEIFEDACGLVALGVRELILIAQDTTFYGKDIGGPPLEALLERLCGLRDLAWIRIMYTHPDHYTEPLIDALASLPKVIPYLDIPVQHISRPVLRRMGRGGGPGGLRRLIDTLRERIAGLVLRTSLIVGFPGETEQDFETLVRFVEEVRFERLGSFLFSAEDGTAAARLTGAVPQWQAAARHRRLMEVQSEIVKAFHDSLLGWEGLMIVDEVDEASNMACGRTYMDAPDVDCTVSVRGAIPAQDALKRIKITSAGVYDLEAQLV